MDSIFMNRKHIIIIIITVMIEKLNLFIFKIHIV